MFVLFFGKGLNPRKARSLDFGFLILDFRDRLTMAATMLVDDFQGRGY
ncbi:MAG: hypothetical protein PHO37_06400 [Kiritimatiellae bacterium]|nr:hypothetical protein [Kiritimatiellia bacterium]